LLPFVLRDGKNMKAHMTRVGLASFVFLALAILTADSTNAQCSTCPAPTVAYQPVVVQPTTVYQPVVTTQRTGWYPGKLFDKMRLRYYGVAAPATTTYAPSTASYAPYTAAAPTYTAGFAPYVTAYAPLRRTLVARPIVQTAYYPVATASPCTSCAQTVARPVILNPVVAAGYPTVPTGVDQASFAQPDCSRCATSAATPSYSSTPIPAATNPAGGTYGPSTPQPHLNPDEPAPSRSNFTPSTPAGSGTRGEKSIVDPLDKQDPLPPENPDTNTSFEAPRLFDPSDRTALRPSSSSPTVDVWNAVYRKSSTDQVIPTSFKPKRTQAEIDADGWQSVPRG